MEKLNMYRYPKLFWSIPPWLRPRGAIDQAGPYKPNAF